MASLGFDVIDGAHRIRVDESTWAGLTAQLDWFASPPWLAPLEGYAADGTSDRADPDEPLRQALELHTRALVAVEVVATSDRTGLTAMLWTDAAVSASVARAARVAATVRPEGRVQPIPGVEISAYPIGSLLDEIMRLVPPAAEVPSRESVDVPEEFSVALARALRTGDGRLVQTIADDLGWSVPPSVVADLAAGITGHLMIAVTSRSLPDTSVGSWLRTRGGWVQLQPTETGHIRHTPCSAADLRRLILSSLTDRLGAELDRMAAASGDAP